MTQELIGVKLRRILIRRKKTKKDLKLQTQIKSWNNIYLNVIEKMQEKLEKKI